ncbi:MAG: hypothetical protein NTZ72_19090 [Afipia sp.]|nr:hypothetical protein [Afipia sp.]
MTNEQPRTDASSRERSPDQQYSLTIEQTGELYAQAGHPRTIRAVQKYCALSKLDCHKVETETGEKYLVAPYSVTRHIAYSKEVRTVASSRDQTREQTRLVVLWKSKLKCRPHHQRTVAYRREQTRLYVPTRTVTSRALKATMIFCAAKWR